MPRKTQMPTNYFLKNHAIGIEKHKGKLNVHKEEFGTCQKRTKTYKRKPNVCEKELGTHCGILETHKGKLIMCQAKSLTH